MLGGGRPEDTVIRVPVGTQVHDPKPGADLRFSERGSAVAAKGGRGRFRNGVVNSKLPLRQTCARWYIGGASDGEDTKMQLEHEAYCGCWPCWLPCRQSKLSSKILSQNPRLPLIRFTTLEPISVWWILAIPLHLVLPISRVDPKVRIWARPGREGFGHIERTKILLHLGDVLRLRTYSVEDYANDPIVN